MIPRYRPRYPLASIRCPACDSSATLRTSQHLDQQTFVCLDCKDVWTTAAPVPAAESVTHGKTTEPRVAAHARGIMAALQKRPAPSVEEIRLMLAKIRKPMTKKAVRTKRLKSR